MKFVVKPLVSILFAGALLAAMYSLRMVPSSRLWSGYQVVYFPGDTDLSFLEREPFNAFRPELVTKASALDTYTTVPVALPLFLQGSVTVNGMSHTGLRAPYFSDSSGSCQLVYVSDSCFADFSAALSGARVPFGSDAAVRFPYAPLAVVLLLFLALAFTAPIPLYRSWVVSPLLFSVFCSPEYSTAVSASAFMCLAFVAERFWNRKGRVRTLFRSHAFRVIILVFLASLVFVPPKGLLLLLLAVLSFFALSVGAVSIGAAHENRSHFKYGKMLPSHLVALDTRLSRKSAFLFAAAPTSLLLLALLFGTYLPDAFDNGLFLPAPWQYTSSAFQTIGDWELLHEAGNGTGFATLADFVEESWVMQSFPYRKVSEVAAPPAVPGATVTQSHFLQTEKGVVQSEKVLLSFDDDYVATCLERFVEAGGIEKVLAAQSGGCTVDYKKTGGRKTSPGDLASAAFAALVFMVMALVLGIKKGRKQ